MISTITQVSNWQERRRRQGLKHLCMPQAAACMVLLKISARSENSSLNPLTAYAKSKVSTEQDLVKLADKAFKVTSLRFSTACGMSERLRLDLVLNDFVAGAVTSKKITILSDGTPWRPLINIKGYGKDNRLGNQ